MSSKDFIDEVMSRDDIEDSFRAFREDWNLKHSHMSITSISESLDRLNASIDHMCNKVDNAGKDRTRRRWGRRLRHAVFYRIMLDKLILSKTDPINIIKYRSLDFVKDVKNAIMSRSNMSIVKDVRNDFKDMIRT